MAYIAGILINVVGFAGASTSFILIPAVLSELCLAGRSVPIAATRIYEMSFFTGFGVSALLYWSLNYLFPVPGASVQFDEIDESKYGDGARDEIKSLSKGESTTVSLRSVAV